MLGAGPAAVIHMKNALFSAVLALLVAAVCLGVMEFGLRHFYFTQWQEQNIVGNPDHRMTLRYHNNINSDGIRAKKEASAYRADDFNIIFLGDSFTYGWRVMAGKTLPAQLEKLAHQQGYSSVQSVNFGWVSSSPFLSHRLLRDIGAKYHPKLVVLMVDMTDFADDMLYENIVEKRHGFIVGQYVPAITLLISQLNQRFWQSEFLSQTLFGVPARHFFIVNKPLSQTRPAFDNLMRNVDAINSYCRDTLGVPFVMMVMPRYFQYDPRLSPANWEKYQYDISGPYLQEPFRYFDEIAGKKPYPVISLLPDFQHIPVFPSTFDDDPHLNEAGNHFAAAAVWKHLQQQSGIAWPQPAAASAAELAAEMEERD